MLVDQPSLCHLLIISNCVIQTPLISKDAVLRDEQYPLLYRHKHIICNSKSLCFQQQ